MNTCIDTPRSFTNRDLTDEMTSSLVTTKGQLNRAKSESALRGTRSRGRGSKERRGFLKPRRTMKKIGIAISNAMKGKRSGGKGRESQSSEPAALVPIPNLEEEDIFAEIEQQKREADNYFGADPWSSFSSVGVASMGDTADFFQRPTSDHRTRSPTTRSKSASKPIPTTPPSRGIRRYNSWFLRRNSVEKDAKIIGNASPSSSRRPPIEEKEQNGWESPLTTPTRASPGLRNSGAYGGLVTGSSPFVPSRSPFDPSRSPPLPRPPLAGPPLHSRITTSPARMGVQKVGKVNVNVRQPSISSVPNSKVPRDPRGNVSSVRGREQQPQLSPSRNIISQRSYYSPPPAQRYSPAIPLALPNQNEFLGPPSNDQPAVVRDSPPYWARPGAQSISLARHPASPISSDLERTQSCIVPQRSDSGRNVSGRCLTLRPPDSSVAAGSLEDMKRSIQRSPGLAHTSFRSQHNNKTLVSSTEGKKPDPPAGVSQIEIAPGILKTLRGSEETWKAIETGNIVPVTCMACSLSLHCLDDAEFVICPACRAVGPVECCLQGFGRGIGLGIKDDQLTLWRAEIQSTRA